MPELDQRDRCRRAATVLADEDAVAHTSVIEPETGARDVWSLELTIDGPKVPSTVLRELAIERMTLLPDQTTTRGDPVHTVVATTPDPS